MVKKIPIRFAKKADIPGPLAEFYSPVNAADPDGEHVFDAFDPDPKGLALVNAGTLRSELDETRRIAERRNNQLQGYRKKKDDPKSELWTDAEIEELVQARAHFDELKGKQPDVDQIRKQVADELNKQFEGKSRVVQKQLETKGSEAEFYRKKYQEALRRAAAGQSLTGLTPQAGLEEIAVNTFADALGFEEIAADPDKGRPFPDFALRVRGDNGWRLDGKGEPLPPDAYARGEFLKRYGSMFKPLANVNGTGVQNSNAPGGGGSGGGAPGGKGGAGSGQYQFKLGGDAGDYQKALKATPKSDFLQIVDGSGAVVRSLPGQA